MICKFVSGGMDCCMYVNMYIVIWWYGRLYVCYYDTLVSEPMYILTYIQPSIPPDTNVHISIHTIVHTTRYQCIIVTYIEPMNVNMYIGI
jgi:hypothetical protein